MSKDFYKDKQSSNNIYLQYFDLQGPKLDSQQIEIPPRLPVFISSIQQLQQSQYFKILVNSQQFQKKFDCATHIKQNCIDTDFQSINIQLHYGPFTTKINVIYLEVIYKEESDSFINSGSFGRIQTLTFNDQAVAVKLIKLNQNKQFSAEIERVYQQYFIALMASELKVGPQLINVFGYQIVFLKNYALFGMELCEKFSNQNLSQKKKITDFQQSLKNSLDILHSLHVVHRDIKPENIMWSPSFQKLVFIDFGLSEIVKERQGEKTLTSYVGSYSYCSPEMQKCFVLQKSRHVDLYENDIFGLEKSLKIFSIVNPNKTKLFIKTQTKNEFFDCLVQISNLKKQFFLRNFENAYNYIKKCKYALKTCLYISNKIKEKQTISQQLIKLWDNWQTLTKQRLINNKLITSYSEQIFLKAIQGNMKNSFSYLIPFSSVLETQLRNLNKWVNNQMWLSRIYFILNPTSKCLSECTPQIIYIIIDKMYSFLQKVPTQIFMKKVRRVLLFFYQKFSQLKKIQLLESLSDFFIIIGDSFKAIKIRNFILTIIKDPLEYCLKNLMYYVLNFQYSLFSRGISIDSLENIRSRINSQISEFYPEILSLVNKFCLNIQYPLSMLQEMLNLFKKLEQKIANRIPQFSKIITRTIIRFIIICYRPADIQMYYWSSNWVEKTQKFLNFQRKLSKQIEKNRAQPVHSLVSLEFNYFFYAYVVHEEYQKFQQTYDQNLIKEYMQFFFQANQNKKRLSINQLQMIIQQRIQTDVSITIIALKESIKWVDKFESLYIRDPKSQIFYIISNICKNIETLCKKIDKNDVLREQSQKLISHALERLRERVNLSVQCQTEKQQLFIFINIASLLRIHYENCQQEILQKGTQLYTQVKSLKEASQLRAHFLQILVNILRKKSFKKQQNVTKLEYLIWNVFKIQSNYDSFLICYEEIIKLSKQFKIAAFFGYNFMFILANYLNCLESSRPHAYRSPYNKSVCLYVQQTTSQEVTNKLKSLDQEKNSIFALVTQHDYGCYLMYKMLQKCHQQSKLVQKYLFKIARCMEKHKNETKIQIEQGYYSFFTKIHKKKVRKLLICQRLETRHNFLQKNMKWTRAKVYKKSQKYPQIVRLKLMRKLNEIFG